MKTVRFTRTTKTLAILAMTLPLCFSFVSCSTTPSIMGLAIFPSAVDFNSIRVGMHEEELRNADVFPNVILSSSPGSYDSGTHKWSSRNITTWGFNASSHTRQFLYFEDQVLVGWEEIDLDGIQSEGDYTGMWKEWRRDYE